MTAVRYVGEIGVPLTVRWERLPGVPRDLANASALRIYLRRPGLTVPETYIATLVTNGSDGLFAAPVTLVNAGRHVFWGEIETDTERFRTREFDFDVLELG